MVLFICSIEIWNGLEHLEGNKSPYLQYFHFTKGLPERINFVSGGPTVRISGTVENFRGGAKE